MLPNDKPEAVRAVLGAGGRVTCRYIDADHSGDTDGRATLQVYRAWASWNGVSTSLKPVPALALRGECRGEWRASDWAPVHVSAPEHYSQASTPLGEGAPPWTKRQGVTSVRKLPNTHVIHTTGAIEARLVARIAVCDGFITTINLDINALRTSVLRVAAESC